MMTSGCGVYMIAIYCGICFGGRWLQCLYVYDGRWLILLWQVIVALSEKSRSHIPYRNSMMTSVLRDSLGGNCMTTMIATCSIEKQNIDVSSTSSLNYTGSGS